MTGRPAGRGGPPAAAATRMGLFGLLGSGNSGNDASLETVLAYLREAHPEAAVDAMCGGPERVRASYGIDTVPIFWYQRFENRTSGVKAGVLKALGTKTTENSPIAFPERPETDDLPNQFNEHEA